VCQRGVRQLPLDIYVPMGGDPVLGLCETGSYVAGMKPALLDPEHLRAFARRDWARVDHHKRQHWAKLYKVKGAQRTIALAHALYEHARSLNPSIAHAGRDEDFAHHVRLKKLMDAAAHAFTVR